MAAPMLAPTPPYVTSNPLKVQQIVANLLKRREAVYLDTETTGLDPRANKLVMVQLRQASAPAAYIIDCRPDPSIVKLLQPLSALRLIGHNLKFDLQFLLQAGVRFDRVFDTMIAEQIILGVGYGEFSAGLNLRDTLKRRCGIEISKLERAWFYEPAPLDERPDEWNADFPAAEIEYAAKDVDLLIGLYSRQIAALKRMKLERVTKIEMRVLPAIAMMEWRGIEIDVDGWRAFIADKHAEATRLENDVLAAIGPHILAARITEYDRAHAVWEQARAGLEHAEYLAKSEWEARTDLTIKWGEFKQAALAAYRKGHDIPARPKLAHEPPNIGSTMQLIQGLDAAGVAVPTKRNPAGKLVPTTDSDNLEKLAATHPIVRVLLDWRKATKFVDAFGEKLLAYADETGALHPDYRQIGAETGRMSCTRPNFQQIPSKGDGDKVRALVRPRKGYRLLTADFPNIELRILATMAKDDTMLEMFASGEDLHSFTARRVFNLGPDVDPKTAEWRKGIKYRAAAKVVNFLIPYGGSAFKLALDMGIPKDEAEALLEQWFALFPQVQAWLTRQERDVKRTLASRTMAGRLRTYVGPGQEPTQPDHVNGDKGYAAKYAHYQDKLREHRKAWNAIKRQARNTPIQGTSADITKLAVAMLYERLPHPDVRIVAVVHDEIVVECPTRLCARVAALQAQAMVDACAEFGIEIPLPEIKPSERWEH